MESLPTKFVNFLATCWEIPIEVLSDVFMDTDTIEERNFIIFSMCFDTYLEFVHEITNFCDMTDKQRTRLFNKHYDNFLAESVKLQYLYE